MNDDYLELMSVEEFQLGVLMNVFTPDDGDGYFLTAEGTVILGPAEKFLSVWAGQKCPPGAVSVAWYNK